MTVMGRIILRFFYKVWFFGAICFCLSWLFLLVNLSRKIFFAIIIVHFQICLLSLLINLCRRRESNIQEYTVETYFEGQDEDDPLIQ